MDCECRNWVRVEPSFLTKHHKDCPKYVQKIIKIWTITPGEGCNPCYERDPKAILSWIENAEPGDVIKVVVGEIDEAVYNELPEYMGP